MTRASNSATLVRVAATMTTSCPSVPRHAGACASARSEQSVGRRGGGYAGSSSIARLAA